MSATPAPPDEDLYEDAPCGYLTTSQDGMIVRLNRTFERWTGHERDDLVGRTRFQELLSPGGRIYHETHFRPLLEMQGSVREIALDIECADGRRLPVLVNSTMRRDGGGGATVRTTIFDATDRRAYERELLRARRDAERHQRHSSLLAEASRVLDFPRSATERAQSLLDLLVATIASGALLHLHGAEDEGAAAGDTGSTELNEALASAAGGTAIAHDGVVAVPLMIRGDLAGALAIVQRDVTDEFGGGAAELLAGIADRAAVAIENARLYERERTVALTLQRALLAGVEPPCSRCTIATHYSPAVDSLEVGGDWYDAFSVGPDRIVAVVGDVVGKGLEAAATMGQLRSALKALAVSGLGPAAVLEQLDAFVEHSETGRGATIALLEIDVASGLVRLACAGHPPPVLLRETGAAELIWEGRSAPIGAYTGVSNRSETTVRLQDGSRLLLYSDGLVERRDRPIDRGIDALMASFERRRHQSLASLGDDLASELVSGRRGADDVCMLMLMFDAPRRFETTIGSSPTELAHLRRDLRAWLDAHQVAAEDRDAVVLACSEAAANALEHGLRDGPGRVEVEAEATAAELSLVVRDDGRWSDSASAPTRGRGLMIVEHLMDDVSISRERPTTVRMRRQRAAT